MSTAWIADLEQACTGRVGRDAPLAPLTTYRIGGPADAILEPAGVDDVQRALDILARAGVPWVALGLGSNVLVADTGFRGLVIHVGKGLATVREHADGWEVGAGLPTPLLARRTARAGRAGVHRLIGVPGSVGGGVYMNAGAHGQEFGRVVRSVTVVTAGGSVEQRSGEAIPWAYRTSGLGAVVVVSADLALEPGNPAALESEVTTHLRWRKAGTPFNEPCCGSVFRNPDRPVVVDGATGETRELRTAGQLIDAAGLKGFQMGDAEVSPMHANYIVNTGSAAAADVTAVIQQVRERVFERFGVTLELEVQPIGEVSGLA